jgi:hypothetical protein
MKPWINWIAAMLLAMAPMVLHLLWMKPKTERSKYDLAGLITNPPASEAKEPLKSFGTIRPTDDVELSTEEIRNCLLKSRELSRPHAVKNTASLMLEKGATESADLSVEDALADLRTNRCEKMEPQNCKTPTEQENENVIRSSNPQNFSPCTGNNVRRGSKRHVSNIDAALEIRNRRV